MVCRWRKLMYHLDVFRSYSVLAEKQTNFRPHWLRNRYQCWKLNLTGKATDKIYYITSMYPGVDWNKFSRWTFVLNAVFVWLKNQLCVCSAQHSDAHKVWNWKFMVSTLPRCTTTQKHWIPCDLFTLRGKEQYNGTSTICAGTGRRKTPLHAYVCSQVLVKQVGPKRCRRIHPTRRPSSRYQPTCSYFNWRFIYDANNA